MDMLGASMLDEISVQILDAVYRNIDEKIAIFLWNTQFQILYCDDIGRCLYFLEYALQLGHSFMQDFYLTI